MCGFEPWSQVNSSRWKRLVRRTIISALPEMRYIINKAHFRHINERSSFVNKANRPRFTDIVRMREKNYFPKYSFPAFLTNQGG